MINCGNEKIVPHTCKSRFCNFYGIKYEKKEKIPIEIVEMLDKTDQSNVDTNVPPRFNCEKCPHKMVPINYIDVKGKIYKYNEN